MSLAFVDDGKLYTRDYQKSMDIDAGPNDEYKAFFTENPFDGYIKAVFTATNAYELGYEPTVFIIDTENRIWSRGHRYRALSLGRDVDNGVPADKFGEVFVDERFDMIACGKHFTVAIDVNGHLWKCGYVAEHVARFDSSGSMKFHKIYDLTKFVDVSAGSDFFVAIDEYGYIWGQGNNSYGALGVEMKNVGSLNVLCPGDFVAVSCGIRSTLCLDSDGDVWCCGDNEKGVLGFYGVLDVPTFTKMSFGAKVVAISAGQHHSVCLLENGLIYACGDNSTRQITDIDRDHISGEFVQIQIDGNQHFQQVFASKTKTMVKDDNGKLWIAGRTVNGKFIEVVSDNEPLSSNVSLANRTIAQRSRHKRTKSARKIYG